MKNNMKAKLLKASGEVVEIEPKNGTDFTLDELYEHLNCALVEVINLNQNDIMVVDEEGKWASKEVNVNATKCAQENQVITSWDYIVGDAIVCKTEMVKMKEFSLEEYLKNPDRKVVTRRGDPVRIICTDADCSGNQIVAIVTRPDGRNRLLTYCDNGQYFLNKEDEADLFFAPEKKVGWMNLYKKDFGLVKGGDVYNSEEAAKKIVNGDEDYITTIKIEWEE